MDVNKYVKMGAYVLVGVGTFLVGRGTAPKPKPEVKYVTKTQVVEKVVTNEVERKQGHVVVDKTKTTEKDGTVIEHTQTQIVYENTKKSDTKSHADATESIDVQTRNTRISPVNIYAMAGFPLENFTDISKLYTRPPWQIGIVYPIGNTLTVNTSWQKNTDGSNVVWLGAGVNFF